MPVGGVGGQDDRDDEFVGPFGGGGFGQGREFMNGNGGIQDLFGDLEFLPDVAPPEGEVFTSFVGRFGGELDEEGVDMGEIAKVRSEITDERGVRLKISLRARIQARVSPEFETFGQLFEAAAAVGVAVGEHRPGMHLPGSKFELVGIGLGKVIQNFHAVEGAPGKIFEDAARCGGAAMTAPFGELELVAVEDLGGVEADIADAGEVFEEQFGTSSGPGAVLNEAGELLGDEGEGLVQLKEDFLVLQPLKVTGEAVDILEDGADGSGQFVSKVIIGRLGE